MDVFSARIISNERKREYMCVTRILQAQAKGVTGLLSDTRLEASITTIVNKSE